VAAGFTSLAANYDFSQGISLGPVNGSTAGFQWYDPGVWWYNGITPATRPFLASSAINLSWTVGDRTGGSVIGTMSPNGVNSTSWKYGYFEVSAKFNTATGLFPAFWMQGLTGTTDYTSIINNTHNYAELDGFEWVSNTPNKYLGTLHTWQGTGGSPPDTQNNNASNSTTFTAGFNLANYNTYGWSWTATQICWYFNNALMNCANSTTFPTFFSSANLQPMYLMLQNQTGQPSTATANTNVLIQWAHVWQ
jgi:hypothetical protein